MRTRTRTRTITALVAALALLAIAAPAVAHDVFIDAEPTGCRQVLITVTAWDGFIDDVYAGDEARTVTAAILRDGAEVAQVNLAAPDFTAQASFIVEAGLHEWSVVPVTAWGDGADADPADGQTITLRSTCTVSTTTTTTTTTTVAPSTTVIDPPTTASTVPPCADNDPGDPTPCPHDAPNPPVDIPTVQEMPDPDPVTATPSFTG